MPSSPVRGREVDTGALSPVFGATAGVGAGWLDDVELELLPVPDPVVADDPELEPLADVELPFLSSDDFLSALFLLSFSEVIDDVSALLLSPLILW